jgi:hypothetical protein|tara:strand:+ start:2502 stop:3014 length:513 start_codon:yes stop_codon:yes gene_type:complete
LTLDYFKGKKGSVSDGIFYVVALFVIAIVFIFSAKVLNDINEKVQTSDIINADGKEMVAASNTNFTTVMNNSFLVIFIGLIIAIIVGAYFIKVHPALYWISIPIMAFVIWLAAIYGNIFNAIITAPEFSTTADNFGIITFIFNNYVYFITGVVLLLALALYAKTIVVREE